MKTIASRASAFILLSCLYISTYHTSPAQQLAFPGAEGFGRYATGGRAGTVYVVTNLNDSGAGSFRDAVSVSNRIVVFAVGGIINIDKRVVVASNITIAGQTAPGDGIMIYGNGVTFTQASNTIVRYLRVRMGRGGDSGADAMGIADDPHDLIFDHVSVSWGRDETFSINGEASNVTIQDCIIAQGLQTHSCGGLVQTPGGVALFRNLYIDNNTRNPKVKGVNNFVNNIVYNWGYGGGYIMGDSQGPSEANIINNYYIEGPSTAIRPFSRGNENFVPYVADNYHDASLDGMLNGNVVPTADYEGITIFRDTPYDFAMPTTLLTPQQSYDVVLANAGANYPTRDTVDRYLIDELTSLGGKGALIAQESDLPMGGPGELFGAPAPLDTDQDGLPDAYETTLGMDPLDGSDSQELTASGYTHLEVYINALMDTPPAPFLRPPSNVVLTSPAPNIVTLQWQDNTADETAFILERGTDGITYQVLATTNADTITYTDTTVLANTRYYYRLKAVNGTDTSVYSTPVSIRTPTAPSAPVVPYNPTPADDASHIALQNITFSWVGSDNTTAYRLWLGGHPDSLTLLTDSLTTTYTVTTLAEATTYYWRVDAYNDLGYSTGDVWTFSTLTVYPPQRVGDWRMDETLGSTAADSSAYGVDGELVDIPAFQWIDGKVNNALSIDSVQAGSGIRVPHHDPLYFTDHGFTVSMWVKAPAPTSQFYLFHKGTFASNASTGATGHWFGLEVKSGALRFAVDDNARKTELSTTAAPFFTDDWVHIVAMRHDATGTLRLYRNAELIAETTDATGRVGTDAPLVLANTTDFNVPYRGQLDEVKIYNYAIPDDTLLALYYTGQKPMQVLDPTPAIGTQLDSTDLASVSWRGGPKTTRYVLFIGRDSTRLWYSGTVPVAQPAYTFEHLKAGTVYYWRVDAVGAQGITRGKTWWFTTAFPRGLTGHWKLDEQADTLAADASLYHQHGNLTAFTTYDWLASGRFNRCLNYTAPTPTAAVTIPHAPQLLFDHHAFTLSLWVRIPENTYTYSTGQDTYLIHKGSFEANTGKWYGMQLRDGKLTFAIDDGKTKTDISATVTGTTNNLFTDTWKHIVAVRDAASTEIRLYIDTVLVASKAYSTGSIGNTYPIMLGNSPEQKPYRDQLDDVRLYNYTLTETEIKALFDGTALPGCEQGSGMALSVSPNPVAQGGSTTIYYSVPQGSYQLWAFDFNGYPHALSIGHAEVPTSLTYLWTAPPSARGLSIIWLATPAGIKTAKIIVEK